MTVALIVLAAAAGALVVVTVSLRRRVTSLHVTGDQLGRMAEVLGATPDLVTMFDGDGRFRYLNGAARAVLGVPVDDDAPALNAHEMYVPDSRRALVDDALPEAARVGVWSGEMVLQLPNNDQLPVSQVIVAHRETDGTIDYFSSISRDLRERRAYEAQLLHQAMHDGLTGLPNRALLLDRLEHALTRRSRYGGCVAVILLDIDRFKLINDSYGLDLGDELLVRAAARLARAARPGDTVARLGGDEFCFLCEDIEDADAATELAKSIATALGSDPFELDDVGAGRIYLTVSAGVVLGFDAAQSAEALLRDADVAMYRAKEKGGARCELFAENLRHTAVNRLRTANDLHRALADGEFRIVYQPEVCLRTGHVLGVEALIRWHHPDRGLVPPAEFVPLAEETGLIDGVGAFVLESAVAQAVAWRTARHDGDALPVWVNLSARQLNNPELVDGIASTLQRYGMSPTQLGIEITESALLEDAEGAISLLTRLRHLGVQLAVDDFGTGYSSLSYLKKLPVDVVKVDRSFVDGLGTDNDDSAIVAAVVGMARALHLTTVAEGVETATQVEALRRLGCDTVQGYYFTAPQPPAHITRLLEADRDSALWPPPELEIIDDTVHADVPQQREARSL